MNLAAVAGAFLGPIIGIAGGFYGINQRIKNAKAEEEKQLLRKLNQQTMVLVVVWFIGVAATLGASYLGRISIKESISIGSVWLAGYFLTLIFLVRRAIRAQRQAAGIQSTSAFEGPWGQGGRDFERQALESPKRWRISVFAGFGGSILGLLGSLLVLAAMAGDWPLYFSTMLFGVVTVVVASFGSLKFPANYWLHLSLAMVGTIFFALWADWFFLSKELWAPTRDSYIGIFTVPEFLFVSVVGFGLVFAIIGMILHMRRSATPEERL